jgi:hypothetical protein
VLVLLALAAPSLAVDYTSVQDGNWGSSSTWSPPGIPGQLDNVSIGHRVNLENTYAVNNLAITPGGKFVISAAYSVQVYGNWTNSGADSLVNGYVFFKGAAEATIGGTTPTAFYRLYISKTSTSDTVYLAQNVAARYPGSYAISVDTGNFVTNGRNVDASVTNARVNGNTTGRFWVTGASQVDIYYLYMWGLAYFYVTSPSAVVNIFRQDIANSGHRMDIWAGTVNYTGTGSNQNLQLYTNNSGWGWYATGGTITFNGSVSVGNLNTYFRASDSAVVRFAGSAASTVNLHTWGSGNPRVSWWFNNLRVEKTGGASVRFGKSGTDACDSMVIVQQSLTVNAGAVLTLTGLFAVGKGYRFPAVTNNGTVNDSAPVYISGNLAGSGAFASGPGGYAVFDGTGSAAIGQPAGFNGLGAAKSGGGSLTTGYDLPVADSFIGSAGTFTLGKHTMTLGTASASAAVRIDSGATFSAVGGADTAAVVTAAAAGFPYSFAVAGGGTIAARYAGFSYMGAGGISIAGTVDAANDFDDCSFDHGDATGPMLKIENGQTLDGLANVAFSGTAGYNVEKLGAAGHVTVTLGGGTRWGEAFDNDPNNLVDWVGPDGGIVAVLAPTESIPLNTVVTPRLRLKNFGAYPATFDVSLVIVDSLTATVYDTTETGIVLAAGDSVDYDFTKTWLAAPRGVYGVTAWTVDGNPENDTALATCWVVGRDVGVSGITAPIGIIGLNEVVTPAVRVTNYGVADAVTGVRLLITDQASNVVYDTTEEGVAVAVGATVGHTFTRTWLATPEARYRVTAFTTLEFDVNPANDTGMGSFQVGSGGGPTGGWTEIAQVPLTPSGKAVKDGGAVAYDASSGGLVVLKGYKTSDFYHYDAVAATWTELAPMPLGVENKGPYKGANICSDGSGTFYATKGNNTTGFWKYAAQESTWTQLADVPLGLSNKKVKGGTDMVYVNQGDSQYVYLLKGYKCEFYRYNTVSGAWYTLAEAPVGVKNKYDKGSWLVYDEANAKLYAHKAKYSEMYAYSLDSLTWGPLIPGMPLPNQQTGKSKKSKDGGDATVIGGTVYSLKGGNTQDFYSLDLATMTWTELDTIPAFGSTAKKKKVKAGSSLANDGALVYALKGNKTLEFWQFDPMAVYSARPHRSGVMAERLQPQGFDVRLGPNPLSTGVATLRYSLPKAGPLSLRVFDVTGRTVVDRSLVAGRAGTTEFDLRSLSAGIYLVKLTADGCSSTHKLVVQR